MDEANKEKLELNELYQKFERVLLHSAISDSDKNWLSNEILKIFSKEVEVEE